MANPGRRKKDNLEGLKMLLEKADIQGYLTTEDLIEVYPDVSKDAEHLSAILVALRRRGVDILDEEGTLEDDDSSLRDGFYYPENSESLTSDDTIGLYLKEMARVPLLSMDEEMRIAACIEAGNNARKEIDKNNGALNDADFQALEQKINEGLIARDHLIKANTRLVVFNCQTVYGTGGFPSWTLFKKATWD